MSRESRKAWRWLVGQGASAMHTMAVHLRAEINQLDQQSRDTVRAPRKERARCGAKTRGGGECKAPALSCGRCRVHGGTGSGHELEGKRRLIGIRRRELVESLEIAEIFSRG